MPALPTKALRTNGASMASVRVAQLLQQRRDRPAVVAGDAGPGTSCARSARSTSGRASPARRRSGPTRRCGSDRQSPCSSARSSDRPRSRFSASEGVVVEAIELDELDTGVGGRLGVDERRLDRAHATIARSPGWPAGVWPAPTWSRRRHRRAPRSECRWRLRQTGARSSRRRGPRPAPRHRSHRAAVRSRSPSSPGRPSRRSAATDRRADASSWSRSLPPPTKHQVSDVDRGDLGQAERVRIGQQHGGAGICGG